MTTRTRTTARLAYAAALVLLVTMIMVGAIR